MIDRSYVSNHEELFSGTDFIISKTDLNGTIIYVNTVFCRISGYKPSELIGQPHNIVRHPDMPPQAFATMWETLKQGGEWQGVIKNRCKNGDHYWVMAKVMPERNEAGEVLGYLAVRRPLGNANISVEEAAATIAGYAEGAS